MYMRNIKCTSWHVKETTGVSQLHSDMTHILSSNSCTCTSLLSFWNTPYVHCQYADAELPPYKSGIKAFFVLTIDNVANNFHINAGRGEGSGVMCHIVSTGLQVALFPILRVSLLIQYRFCTGNTLNYWP